MTTPYEMWFGHKPDVSMLRVWGCRAYMMNNTYTKALTPKGISLVCVGYQPNAIGYRLLDTKSNKIYIGYNVTFKEFKFPFKEQVQQAETHWEDDSSNEEDEQEQLPPPKKQSKTTTKPTVIRKSLCIQNLNSNKKDINPADIPLPVNDL
jgi:hypothetical protein